MTTAIPASDINDDDEDSNNIVETRTRSSNKPPTLKQRNYHHRQRSSTNQADDHNNHADEDDHDDDHDECPSTTQPSTNKLEPYYHNLFQWEQLVSKGVTRPLLINDLDFTDLRDEDDCDLLTSNNSLPASKFSPGARNNNSSSNTLGAPGGPLTIDIPAAQQQQQIRSEKSLKSSENDQDSIDSGTSIESPTNGNATEAPVSAPPPLPPPPISPWFNTFTSSTGSRPQSQFMSSPSPPPYESQLANQRDQSPANSMYSNYSSRNSICVPPMRESSATLLTQYRAAGHHPAAGGASASLRSASSMSSLFFGHNGNKRKKTMKLFWKEVREDRSLLSKLTKKKTIWDEIKPVQIDTQKLEHLFESKAKDFSLSKSRNGLDGLSQRKVKITVLDAKRSNAINIGMTKLPPMRTIKSAILKMDSSIMNREGIEKILTTMMPTEEEKSRIIEAQLANPDTPLGTAEQFLLNLASISALEARLKLWAFQLDYAQIEKEVAEPLMDLKQAIEEIEQSETFRIILGTLLAIGNFLNSTNAKGFQIDYLEKVPEVKDTVHKHSLLHHLCLFIQEKYDPELTNDLYSEFSAVNRASKVEYTEVAKNLKKMQQDCKASWDYLKIVAKHDGLANLVNACASTSSNSNSSNGTTTNNSTDGTTSSSLQTTPQKSAGKLNNLSKLSMITTVVVSDRSTGDQQQQSNGPTTEQLKTRVSDFLTDCAERIMVLMVIHRRVMNRFQKLLVYLGCPSHQIKQSQPQQILKIINEFALEYRTKRERVREMLARKQQQQLCSHHYHLHHNHHHQHNPNKWQMSRSRWTGSQHCIDSSSSSTAGIGGGGLSGSNLRPSSVLLSCSSSCAMNSSIASSCNDSMCNISLASDQSLGSVTEGPASVSCLHANRNSSLLSDNRRASSPSSFSQMSNYSDYLFNQSYCDSRQQSVTPVPSDRGGLGRRPHSMFVSMMNLQRDSSSARDDDDDGGTTPINGHKNDPSTINDENEHVLNNSSKQKEHHQLRHLLGNGKSFDETCNELYQLSHWSSTMTRVTRPRVRLAKLM